MLEKSAARVYWNRTNWCQKYPCLHHPAMCGSKNAGEISDQRLISMPLPIRRLLSQVGFEPTTVESLEVTLVCTIRRISKGSEKSSHKVLMLYH